MKVTIEKKVEQEIELANLPLYFRSNGQVIKVDQNRITMVYYSGDYGSISTCTDRAAVFNMNLNLALRGEEIEETEFREVFSQVKELLNTL